MVRDVPSWPNSAIAIALGDVRFRNGPLCVKSTNQSFAAELLLPSVVDKVAATLCMSERIRSANLFGRDFAT